nr:unnamed protein product [Callosobruchus analis]
MCPSYKMPCRKTVSASLLDQTYSLLREKISEKLSRTDFVCVTTDSWTSINNDSFIAITVHYLAEAGQELKLCSYLLDCFDYEERHTAQNLASILQEKFVEWKIENKIVCVVSDNASNILSAVRIGGWRSHGCFAHTINHLVQNGLRSIKPIIDKVKAIVAFFKRSSSALAKLKITQVQMGLPEVKLKQDVPTRWNSTLDMIQRIIQIREAVIATLALESPGLNTVSNEDWLLLSKLVDILQIFKDIVEEMSAEKTITVSKILIFVRAIYNHLMIRQSDTDTECQHKLNEVINDMLNEFIVGSATLKQ